jgi:hypothetical protein
MAIAPQCPALVHVADNARRMIRTLAGRLATSARRQRLLGLGQRNAMALHVPSSVEAARRASAARAFVFRHRTQRAVATVIAISRLPVAIECQRAAAILALIPVRPPQEIAAVFVSRTT